MFKRTIGKALAAGALLAMAWGGAIAQDGEDAADAGATAAITWPVPWRAGVRVEYDQTYRSESVRNGTTVLVTGSDRTSVEIVRADTGGFVQRWTSHSPKLDTSALPAEMADMGGTMQAALNAMAGIALDVRLDPEGTYQGIANLDEVHAQYSAALRSMFASLVEKASANEAARDTLENVLDMLTARAVMEQQLGEQPAAYNFVAGGGLELDAQYTYDDEGTSPIGGKPIRMKNRMQLTQAQDPDFYALRWEVEPDLEATTAMIEQAARQMMAPQLEQADAQAAPEFDAALKSLRGNARFATTVDYLIHRDNGIVERMQHVQVKRFGQKDDTTTTTYQRRR